MDKRDFSSLYRKYKSDLHNFANRLTGSQHRAEDLVQQSMLKAYRHKEKLNEPSKFKSWANSILYNTHCTNYNKRSRRRKLIQEQGQLPGFFYNKKTTSNRGFEHLKAGDIKQDCADSVNTGYEAFMLHYKGYSYKEIAEKLNISIGAVKSRIHNLRKKMRDELTAR